MKIVLIGDTQVGKTCIIRRLSENQFSSNVSATIGAAFQNHIMQTKKGSVSFQIWDTAGQEKFRALAPMYYRSASVAILCFDLTNKQTFESLEQWFSELKEKASHDLRVIVVGTKNDLVDERVIEENDGILFARFHGALFYTETSAKTGDGIIELFTRIAETADIDVGPIIATEPCIHVNKGEDIENQNSCCK